MFSGPGISAFFQPIRAAGTEAVPAQAIAALHKTGDEQKKQTYTPDEKEDTSADAASIPAAGDDVLDDAFAEDHTALSIGALRGLLTGKDLGDGADKNRQPESAAPPTADALMQQAAAAYQHAEAVKPAGAPPAAGGFVPPPRDQATASDILLMLAEIEAAGINRIAVRDGASIYDTLAALCWSLQR